MSRYEEIQRALRATPRVWLVTGAAGFIGSHLVERLLSLGQLVRGLDNLSTGHRHNLENVRSRVTPEQWACFELVEGDLVQQVDCQRACAAVDYVLHQAALGSVPRSLADPRRSHVSNVDGFMNMLIAARDAKAKRFVYASSSSVYGDHPALPKVEASIGRPLSPYAATKLIDEIYADVFQRCYGLPTTGLRYFNVFGPRQDPEGAYAAVVPRWFAALLNGEQIFINGDGETSRDFCFVENAVQANLLSAVVERPATASEVFNVACGQRTTLRELFAAIRELVATRVPQARQREPEFCPERAGDVRHSLADVDRARNVLGYAPTHLVAEGLRVAFDWYGRDATADASLAR